MDEYSTGISMKESHAHFVCCGRNTSTALAKRYTGGCSKCYEQKNFSVEPKDFTYRRNWKTASGRWRRSSQEMLVLSGSAPHVLIFLGDGGCQDR